MARFQTLDCRQCLTGQRTGPRYTLSCLECSYTQLPPVVTPSISLPAILLQLQAQGPRPTGKRLCSLLYFIIITLIIISQGKTSKNLLNSPLMAPRRSKGSDTGSVWDRGTCRAWLFESQIAKHVLLLGMGPGEALRATVPIRQSECQPWGEGSQRGCREKRKGGLERAEDPS